MLSDRRMKPDCLLDESIECAVPESGIRIDGVGGLDRQKRLITLHQDRHEATEWRIWSSTAVVVLSGSTHFFSRLRCTSRPTRPVLQIVNHVQTINLVNFSVLVRGEQHLRYTVFAEFRRCLGGAS